MAYKKYKKGAKKPKVAKAVKEYVKHAIAAVPELKQFSWQHSVGGSFVFTPNSGAGQSLIANWNRGPSFTTALATVVDPTSFVQGALSNQRVGSDILIHSLDVIFNYGMNTWANDNPNLQVTIFQDKWPENTSFSPGDMFYDVGAGNTVYSPYKVGEKDQFVVYKRKVLTMGQQPGVTSVPAGAAGTIPAYGTTPMIESKRFHYRKEFKPPLKQKFYDNAAAAASSAVATGIEKGALYIHLVSDVVNVSIDKFFTSITYTDA